VVIDNPLGAIFRGVNIVEYKSPGHHLSMFDYLKAGAYARLYASLTRISNRDITITFVVEAYPKKLMGEIAGHGYKVKKKGPGIYYVLGDMFEIQVVVVKQLTGEDGGLWLKDLRRDLNGEELQGILEKSSKMPKSSPLSAYLWMVVGANKAKFKELMTMSSAFEEVVEKYGLTAKWEARGRERGRKEGLERGLQQGREQGRKEAVKKLQKRGMKPVEIAKVLELPLNAVFKYLGIEQPEHL
jgi:hypothetical protein